MRKPTLLLQPLVRLKRSFIPNPQRTKFSTCPVGQLKIDAKYFSCGTSGRSTRPGHAKVDWSVEVHLIARACASGLTAARKCGESVCHEH